MPRELKLYFTESDFATIERAAALENLPVDAWCEFALSSYAEDRCEAEQL